MEIGAATSESSSFSSSPSVPPSNHIFSSHAPSPSSSAVNSHQPVNPPSSSLSSTVSQPNRYDDDEDEGDVCRICRNPVDDDNPLRYPCACSGSIKFVHQDCLLQWLNHSNARNCEVCKHAFSFSPIYAENAPARLPFKEFVVGMAMKACHVHVLQFILRLAFVLSVWLLIIPFITFWIWRLTFVRSLGEAQMLFLSHFSAPMILTDCLHGFLLSGSIVFIFIGATSFRDFFRDLIDPWGDDAEREDEERHDGRARVRHPGPIQPNGGEDNVEDAGGAHGIAGAGQIIRRNAEVAARLEAHVEQIFDGLDDADGAEDVPFDELVGMQGPIFHLVENAITVLASNAIFLGIVIFIPFSLGRLILFHLSWFFSLSSSSMMPTVMPFTESAFSLANITLKNALTAVKTISSDNHNNSVAQHAVKTVSDSLGNVTEITSGINRTSDVLNGTSVGSTHLSDATTLAIGYLVIFCLFLVYLSFVALVHYTRGEPLSLRMLYESASIAEVVLSLLSLLAFFEQFVALIRHIMTMVKVAFLLIIELGVFPLMCGWWLDICTIRMLGATITQRVEFFSLSPLGSSFIHWLVGIIYMLQTSIFVSLLRGVLRNGVLYFLRDPADPNYNPFRDLIDDPVHKHTWRVLLSVAVYGSLIVMLVFLPVKLAMHLAPSIFPLDITVLDPFTEIPADMLLFQICIPFAIEHFKPRATVKAILHQWFTVVGWALGLTDYLLPGAEDNNGQENGNGELARRDRPGVQEHGLMPMVAGENLDRRVHVIGNADVAEDSDADDQADSEYCFAFRIILLLVLAWTTLLLFNSALITVPISLGRALFNAIPRLPITHGIKCNDLYAFNIGCYIIWAAVAGIRYCMDYIMTQRTRILLSQVGKLCAIVLKSSALLSIWVFVIPVLIGLLFELLVIVPMRVPVDKSPVFLLYQDWALGLVFLKIWTRLVMLDQMTPFVDESWRIKFERVKEDGFSRMQGLWVLREIVLPILSKLLTALCFPYVFAKGIFPVLGYSLIVNSAVYRFAWFVCLLFGMVFYCTRTFNIWFTNLHNSIRDDRYLIGRRLRNFGEDNFGNRSHLEIVPENPDLNSQDGNLIHHEPEAEVDLGLRLRRNWQQYQQVR